MIKDTLPNNKIIYQLPDQNNYTQDSLLLANFISINKKCNAILELCCGNGPISLMLNEETVPIVGIDIQPDNIELFKQSCLENNLHNIYPIVGDINRIEEILPANSWDLIICNPPYFRYNEDTRVSNKQSSSIARHEILIDFETIVSKTKTLLSNKGKFIFIHITDRLDEIIKTLYKYNFSIAKMLFIYTDEQDAKRVIIEAVKHDNVHTKVMPSIFAKN